MVRGSGPRIGVVGAGIAGLAVAASLNKLGFDVEIFEQASAFARVGAGIMLAPNAVMALRGIDLDLRVESVSVVATSLINREADTGELLFELALGEQARSRYNAPYLLAHRGDLHTELLGAVGPDRIQLGTRLCGVDPGPNGGMRLHFDGGRSTDVDIVIGADGIHSAVRAALFTPVDASFTGRVAYRTVFPSTLLDPNVPAPKGFSSTKWWGSDRHIVIYYINGGREIYFTTSIPDDEWAPESWSATGSMDDVRRALTGFHPEVQAVLDACPAVNKWAICDRDPLPSWHTDSAVLLGDAAHPMTPYMAQGAATSLEDAVILARCLKEIDAGGLPAAFARYEQLRQQRTAMMQRVSRSNTWLNGQTDPTAVYGYDAWTVPLSPAPGVSAGFGPIQGEG